MCQVLPECCPNDVNLDLCLEKCASLRTLKQTHAQVFQKGLHQENYVSVKLVSFCSKTLGCIGYARMIFNSVIRLGNVFLWTTMITCYTNHGSEATKEAILVYKMMHRHGPRPNNFTLSSVLKACSSTKAIWEGNQINIHAMKLGFVSSIYVQTALLDMYAKFGWIQEATHLFSFMSETNVVACNAMIACYAKAQNMDLARRIFDKMPRRDLISWAVMISGYAGHGNMLAAREVFDQMPARRGIDSWNALFAAYFHYGDWQECLTLFKDLQMDCARPNHVTMAILLSACGHLGALKISSQFHGLLLKCCIEMNIYLFNSLVDMYAKCGSINEAYAVFSEIPVKDVISYNTMIVGFANHGHGKNALKLLSEMLEIGIQPDTVTFLGILTACNQAGLLDVGRHYFNSMSRVYAVEPSVDHYACMVDLFGRAGLVVEAYGLVKTMPLTPHAGVWGALLNACRTYGHVEVGKIAAQQLLKIEPANPGNYVLLSNIYARARLWNGVLEIRHFMRRRGVAKTAGCSWIELNHGIEEFLMGDVTHPLLKEILAVTRHLSLQSVEDVCIQF